MGRKRKLKGLEARKKINMVKKYWRNRGKRVMNTFNEKISKNLKQIGIYADFDLQDNCEKEPEKLLSISGFGPMKVKEICKKVGIQLEIDELNRLYRNMEK